MSQKLTIIKPVSGRLKLNLAELWEYRELAWMMMLRDIKVRYKQAALGVAWAVIQPVTTMLIFTLLFGRLAKIPSDGVAYPVFVFSGLLGWTFFSSAVSNCANSMVGSAAMVSKVYFPRLVIPFASIGVSLIDFLCSFVVLLLLMFIYSIELSWQIILVPMFLFGLLLSVLGVGLFLSAVTVTYRDFRFIVPFMLQIWMYITPVIYPVSFIPESYRWLIYLNPVNGWVSGMRSAFISTPIDWTAVLFSVILTAILLVLGTRYFVVAERRFADVI